ncbi:MAG: bifunctional glutamate N-acetyltransferase/amino-acid acetyltransferase ArgJ [Acidimicrobiia bacterium]|nr:bifunctional glutamate N-acetyltransferase/amino-acid acetyltransferase ArgJ [Acidimicrobiia bacterium]
MASFPDGFGCFVANLGIKDDSDDLVVIAADVGCSTAGVFTKSRFAGPSVELSRERVADGRARAIVVVSKNANVATGNDGRRDAAEVTSLVAEQLGCAVDEVLIASTGVIGRRYPMERVRNGLCALASVASGASVERAARAMMTTDTVAKVAESAVESSTAQVVGIAKGVGMIEPDMATMIAVILTDAEVPADELDATFRRVVERTFNCVSIDTDTSTSDTALVMASGAAGSVRPDALERALESVATELARKIAADGEGATTLIEVVVDAARDWAQAKRVAKSIVNSPLVKTAVHGADPNWGRVAMAVGKCSDDTDIDPDRVVIRFGTDDVYPRPLDDDQLAALSRYLERDEVLIHVSLGTGDAFARVWGCDLTDGYIRINADYTT